MPTRFFAVCFARPPSSQERTDRRFRLAVGSFLEEYNNRVDIITARAPRRSAG
jgi:hypothetical protein